MTSPQAQATATDAAGRHEPVLLQRCLDLLAPAVEGVDGRSSGGGCCRSGHDRLYPGDGWAQ